MKKLIYMIGFVLSITLFALLLIQITDIMTGFEPELMLLNPAFKSNTIYWMFGIQLFLSIFAFSKLTDDS